MRDGLARHVVGRTVTGVQVRREYSLRRHAGGPADFCDLLVGRTLTAAVRRGKFLWLPLDSGAALMVHLGMSGQLLIRDRAAEHPQLRVRISLAGPAGVLDFVDQRTFGHLSVCPLVPTADGAPGGRGSDLAALPRPAAHIARDLLDPNLDRAALEGALRRRRAGVKRLLLDQGLVSGIGNIYADESLWRARVHPERPANTLTAKAATTLLDAAAQVMTEATAAGGTSFDALYVNVNGASGYFDRSLAVYGRAGRPCPRCAAPIVREPFGGRSSFRCPRCQRARRETRRSLVL